MNVRLARRAYVTAERLEMIRSRFCISLIYVSPFTNDALLHYTFPLEGGVCCTHASNIKTRRTPEKFHISDCSPVRLRRSQYVTLLLL